MTRSNLAMACVFLLAPIPALALDLDFYTYDAFQETCAGFTRLALVMSDASYLGYATTFAMAGVLVGALILVTKLHMGKEQNPISWLIPILFGICIFKGLVLPTGTLYVYDPVRNDNTAIGGVPDIVVLMAGGLNELERGIIQIVDTASSNPYATSGGMLNFNLLVSTLGSQPDDADLNRSMARYYSDCGTFAVSTGYNGLTLQELLRSTPDLYGTFAKMDTPAIWTVWYAAGSEAGTSLTCADDWTNNLSPALSAISEPALTSMESASCNRTGFDTTVAAELSACDSQIANLGTLFGLTAGSTGSATVLRSIALAKSMISAMQSGDFGSTTSQLMNRQMLVESMGSAQAMNQWIPRLRAFITAIVCGLFPLCALFLMTPLALRAIGLVGGLFMWIFFWGICDAIASTIASDAAVNALADVSRYALGFDAIMNAPSPSIEALGIFGKARAMALTLSTVLSGVLMHFGGLGLSNLAQYWQSDVERKGTDAATTTTLPERRGAFMEQMSSSLSGEAVMARQGFDSVAGSGFAQRDQAAARWGGMVASESFSGMRPVDVTERAGELAASRSLGEVSGALGASQHLAGDAGDSGFMRTVSRSTALSTEQKVGQDLVQGELSGTLFGSPAEAGAFSGASLVGDLSARQRVFKNINGEKAELTPENVQRLGTQSHASAIGQSEVVGPDGLVQNYATQTEEITAGARELEKHHAAAEVGRGGALDKISSAQGTEASVADEGIAAIARGKQFHTDRSAESAAAATQAGGLKTVARNLSRSEIAGGVGRFSQTQNLARILGRDPEQIDSLIDAEAARSGQFRAVLSGHDKDTFLNAAEDAGLSPRVVEQARTHPGALTIDSGTGGDGSMAYLSAASGAKFDQVDLTTMKSGDEQTTIDSKTQSYVRSQRVSGGAALFTFDEAEPALRQAFAGGNIARDQRIIPVFDSLMAEAGSTLATKGISLSNSTADQVNKDVAADGSAAFRIFGMGGGFSGHVVRSWSSTSQVGGGNAEVLRGMYEAIRREAIRNYDQERGDGAWIRDQGSNQADEWIGLRVSSEFASRLNEIADAGSSTLERISRQNAVVGEQIMKGNNESITGEGNEFRQADVLLEKLGK